MFPGQQLERALPAYGGEPKSNLLQLLKWRQPTLRLPTSSCSTTAGGRQPQPLMQVQERQ